MAEYDMGTMSGMAYRRREHPGDGVAIRMPRIRVRSGFASPRPWMSYFNVTAPVSWSHIRASRGCSLLERKGSPPTNFVVRPCRRMAFPFSWSEHAVGAVLS